MASQGKKHGSYRIHVIPPILYAEGFGAWNDETAYAYCEELKTHSLELSGNHWGTVIDQRQWALGTPKVWELFDELLIHMLEHGLVCEAILPSVNLQKHLAQKHFQSVQPNRVAVQFFTDYDEAHQWCKDQLKQANEKKS